jgi:hypothetical protein
MTEEFIYSLPLGAFFAYFLINFLGRSLQLQRVLPINVAPKWMNKDVVFFTTILNELLFVYWCYELFTVPDVRLLYAVPCVYLFRGVIVWFAKLRALGVFVSYLQKQIKNEESQKLESWQEEVFFFKEMLKKTQNHTKFWNEVSSMKSWKSRD